MISYQKLMCFWSLDGLKDSPMIFILHCWNYSILHYKHYMYTVGNPVVGELALVFPQYIYVLPLSCSLQKVLLHTDLYTVGKAALVLVKYCLSFHYTGYPISL